MVEGFEHLNDPRSYVVRGLMPLVGSPKANRSEVTGQTKIGSKAPNDRELRTSPGLALLGPHPGARPGVGARR